MSAAPIRVLLPVFVAALLTGCMGTLAPRYEQPAAPIPTQWPKSTGVLAEKPIDIPWQTLVADPRLRQVVQLALDNNRDLRVAVLNIEKARAQYGIQRATLFPEVSAGLGGNSGRTPASVSPTGTTVVNHVYSANLGVTAYELDLFGRVRSLNEQALQQYLASEEAQRASRIGLISEVAVTYFNLAADIERLTLARDTLGSRQQAYDLQRQLREFGSTSDLTLRQAEAEQEAAQDLALALESTVATDRNALELLVGTPLPTELHPDAPLEAMLAMQDLPTGLPSDLLQRRPDILAAEHVLIGAQANIGAARAAFFPRITLTGGFGRASDSLSDLFDGASRAWNFLPQISIPIFTGGRLNANLKVAEVDRDIALASYERSIQAAFREVADSLAVRATLDGRLSAQQRQVDASNAAYKLVRQRYDNGVSGYLEVLDAQRTLHAAQQNWIAVRQAKLANLVTLYKALGGDLSLGTVEANKATNSTDPFGRNNDERLAVRSQ
ncbi:efflux transporter outer membrane subunit [Azospira sp. I09]|jgi:multidrug efflux system outer membrane protein|uniref:efflux transporter outer membrane subunit n=1 Tax=Azospira sp. I09 TaxID=1765049 RepID=UPI00126092E0|nr:efflux transporter outer membrane subunit [Azospira sp. I09]BBN90451.1 adeC/adeK/oprM family multidrug efflux complex outer membrane factor [Azospira sp. I09]